MTEHKTFVRPGYTALTAEVVVDNALNFIEFCMSAFEATATEIVSGVGNTSVLHATVRIGDTLLFVADESPLAKRTSSNLYVYVANADEVFQRAIAAGATVSIPIANMPWGDRWGMVVDPFGNYWQIATHYEDVAPAEVARRLQQSAPAPAPRRATNREVIQSYFDHMNAGRWTEYLALYAEDVVMDEQMAGHHEGKDHLRQAVGMLQQLQQMPHFHNEVLQIMVEGDRAVALWRMRLVAPNGTPVDCRGANYFWLREGKIKYFSNFHDTVPFLPLFPAHR